jgi:hypothetical protein
MRNLFDQYEQPENRLTHALAVCLYEDRGLLKDFVSWLGILVPASARSLTIHEQGLPGDPPEDERDTEPTGLPDIVIHDDHSWCLLIESKIQARLSEDQILRHERTLARRGFTASHRVTLTKSNAPMRRTTPRTWAGLYEWLGGRRPRSEWADRLRQYLRVAEVRLARDGYLTEGTLTRFDGFPFSEDNPYTYGEAKRLLRLALAELKKDHRLRQLGMDPQADGRPAITGRSATVVWDCLPLVKRPRGAFTRHPHLTLAVHSDHLEVSITIPNAVAGPVRKRLRSLEAKGLSAINAAILRRARPLLKNGAEIRAYALQRHYASQRSPAVTDATLSFRLETSERRGIRGVKPQSEWVETFAELARNKRSNIQFQYRVEFGWGETPGLDTRQSLKLIVDAWTALSPLLDALVRE